MNPFPESQQSLPTGPPATPLRKLIRARTTKAFLTQSGTWTHDFANAAVFLDAPAAAAAIKRFALDDVELYYSFERGKKSEWDFATSF